MEQTLSLPELFGSMLFGERIMKERLSKSTFQAWKKSVSNGTQLELSAANEIAEAMKQWALEKGATHFTHWFQPMTGVTAEKHDSFIEPVGDGTVVMEFSGKELVRSQRLHCLGSHVLRLCEGPHPVYPHHFLRLLRPGTGQKDAALKVHG